MPHPIKITIGDIVLTGTLLDNAPARVLLDMLPAMVRMTRWGDEYYGPLLPPLGEHEGRLQETMAVGDLAYWEPGEALCLFFGPTPASREGEPRAASPVHLLGNFQGDWASVRLLGAEVLAHIDEEF
jgi:hypothetical protein